VQHTIHVEDTAKPYSNIQRRLNLTIQEVARKKILNWLDLDIIYPILDSKRVNPIQVVPRKMRIIVVKNCKDEFIPTRIQSGW